MATTSIRTSARRRFKDLLANNGDLAGVQVSYAWNQAGQEDRSIYLGGIEGTSDIANLRAGRKHRDERFDLEVFIFANYPGDPDGDLASEACEDLYAVVENVLADDPLLAQDGINLPGLISAVLTDSDGPHPAPTDEGYRAAMRCIVAFHARLT